MVESSIRRGLRIFLCPMLVSLLNNSSSLFIIELKIYIFIINYTLDNFDIADPSSMQDACHIST